MANPLINTPTNQSMSVPSIIRATVKDTASGIRASTDVYGDFVVTPEIIIGDPVDGKQGLILYDERRRPYMLVSDGAPIGVSVMGYGAVANDSSEQAIAANNAAFVAAFAGAEHTELVTVPAGDFYISQAIDMTDSNRLQGAGHQATRIIQTVASEDVIHLSGAGCYLSDMEIGHLTSLDMSLIARPFGSGIRIVQLQDRSVLQRLHIINNVTPIYCKESPTVTPDTFVMSATIRDIRAIGFTEAAIYLSNAGSGGSTGIIIDNYYATNVTYSYEPTSVYFFQGLSGSHFRQLNAEGITADWGIQINTCRGLTLESIHFEGFTPNNDYGALFYVAMNAGRTVRIQGVEYIYSTIDSAKSPNYCFLRMEQAPNVELEGVVVENLTLVGSPTLFRFYGAVTEGAAVYSRRNAFGPFTSKFFTGATTPVLRLDEDKIEYSNYSRFAELDAGGSSGQSSMFVDNVQALFYSRLALNKILEPGNAPTDQTRFYTVKNGSGQMELRVKGPTGSSSALWTETIGPAGGPPTGPAGGVLSGTYPNPGFAADMATQAELDAVSADVPHLGTVNTLTNNNIFKAGAWAERTTITDVGFGSYITGDTNYRWYVDASGKQIWGPGNVVGDTNLYRSAADTLKTDDAFQAASYAVGTTPLASTHLSDSSALARLAGPALTGVPTAPTAAADTNTTQVATTAFVLGQAGSSSPVINGTAAAGTSPRYSRQDHVHPTDTSRAPLASPTFTGTPAAPTAALGTNTTQVATTAFVSAVSPTTFVTSLPASPGSGQRCLFQTTAMAGLAIPVMWPLIYDGTKWLPLGGAPIYALITNTENTTSATYTALTTAGPTISVPVAGDYDIEIGYLGTGTAAGAMSYDIGGTGAVDADNVVTGESATLYSNVMMPRRKTFTAVTLTAKYRTLAGGTAAFFQQRWMRLTPVRLG